MVQGSQPGTAAAQPAEERLPLWPDRQQAGRELAQRLLRWEGRGHDGMVVAVPRGGVAVAVEVAERLRLPITTWSVRKLTLPDDPELAIGAIGPGAIELWDDQSEAVLASRPELRRGIVAAAREELERRQHRFGDATAGQLRGHHLIVVDDGIATGLTVCAAIDSLRATGPASLTLAVPVVDRQVKGWLAGRVDAIEVLELVQGLRAVGLYYRRFEQLDDATVIALLERCRRRTAR